MPTATQPLVVLRLPDTGDGPSGNDISPMFYAIAGALLGLGLLAAVAAGRHGR